jgi:hypothetical protein
MCRVDGKHKLLQFITVNKMNISVATVKYCHDLTYCSVLVGTKYFF